MNPKKYRIDPNDGDRQKDCAWLATYNKMFMPAWGDV